MHGRMDRHRWRGLSLINLSKPGVHKPLPSSYPWDQREDHMAASKEQLERGTPPNILFCYQEFSLLIFTVILSANNWNLKSHLNDLNLLTFFDCKVIDIFSPTRWMWHLWHLLLWPLYRRSRERLGVEHGQTSGTYPVSQAAFHFSPFWGYHSQLQVDLRLLLTLMTLMTWSDAHDDNDGQNDGLAGAVI